MTTVASMEVLFVTATLPYPPNSGATTRTFHLIKRLAARHRLHLVAYGDPFRDRDKVVYFQKLCASVTIVPWRETKRTLFFYVELLLNLSSPTPLVVSRFTRPAMANAIERLVEAKPIDLICCDFLTLSLNFRRLNGTPALVTAHNVESVLWKRYLDCETNPLKALYIYLQYRKLLRFERVAPRRFQHVVCVSREDLEQMRGVCPSLPYSIVPNGVDLEYFTPKPQLEVPYRLVFTGALDWRPNQDAIGFFLSRIYPYIKQAEPRASLYIVGRHPSADLQVLASASTDVTIVGTVPDMRPYLASAAVYVVPLRAGGGTRLKILEAMAMKRPVVSTTIGCEGLTVTPGRDLLVADRPDAFAHDVLRLFRDSSLAASIGHAGHRLVHQAYGWDQIAGILDDVWTKTTVQGAQAAVEGAA